MRTVIIIFGVLCLPAATAYAEDHGHIAFHINTPKAGCDYVMLTLTDSDGKRYSPNANSIVGMELAKEDRKNTLTDIMKFHVKPGRHKLRSIRCGKYKQATQYNIDYRPYKAVELPKGVRQSNLYFDVVEDQTIYMGALDFVNSGPDRSWPLAVDRSEEAVKNGRLEAGTFIKQFLTLELDAAAVSKSLNASKDLSALERLQDKPTHNKKPPLSGKGELALHFKGGSCSKREVYFKNILTPKEKNIKIKIKNTYSKKSTGFGSKKVPSGRYEFKYSKCINGNRYSNAPALAKSFVDVYPDEISYAGQIHQENKLDLSSSRQIKTKYRYLFSSDRFDEAKTEVKKPENLVDRSSTMTDSLQLALSGLQNYMARSNRKWQASLSQYQALRKTYEDEGAQIPGYNTPLE